MTNIRQNCSLASYVAWTSEVAGDTNVARGTGCLLWRNISIYLHAEDVRAFVLFVGDSTGHHQEWLGSTTTNRHGVAPFDFVTVSGFNQLIVDPTHAGGGTLDLLMTDVPDLLRVAVVAPIYGTQIIPLCLRSFRWLRLFKTCVLVGKFSLNIKSIGIQFVAQYRICLVAAFGLLTILLRY